MIGKLVSALAVCAALAATSPAHAASCKKDSDCASGQVCAAGKCTAKAAAPAPAPAAAPASGAAVNTGRIAWGGIGYYNVTVTVNTALGNFSSSTGAFGIHAGGAINLLQLTPDLPLAAWANLGIAFPSGGTFWPITGGAAVRYDKLPVQLLGGLGLTVMPASGNSPTAVGLAIQAMGFLPLPQVNSNLSAVAAIAYHILNQGESLFTFTVGGGWAL
jgi:Cys-rich repeat protein